MTLCEADDMITISDAVQFDLKLWPPLVPGDVEVLGGHPAPSVVAPPLRSDLLQVASWLDLVPLSKLLCTGRDPAS